MLRGMRKSLLNGGKSLQLRLRLFSLVVVFVLLSPWPALAQQQVAMMVNRAKAGEEQRTSMHAFQKRRDALKRYLVSLSPESLDYAVTERAIRELDAKLQQFAVAAPPPTNQSPLLANASDVAVNFGGSLSSAAGSSGTTGAAPLAGTTIPSNTTAVALQTNCFPDAPSEVVTQATQAAILVVDNRGGFTDLSLQLVTFSLLHTVAMQSRTESGRQSLATLRELRIREVQEETKRTDKQLGASARSEGTTSAAEKPNFQTLLGIALENGAIQKEIDGTTLTLSSSPYALVAAARGDSATTYKEYEPYSRLGLSASFNISNQENALASATRSQLSEASARFRFTKDRSIRSFDVERVWETEILPGFQQLDIRLTDTMVTLFQNTSENEALRREVDTEIPVRIQRYLSVKTNADRTRDEKIADIRQIILCGLRELVFDRVVAGRFNISDDFRRRIVEQTIPDLAAAVKLQQEAVNKFEARIKEIEGQGLGSFVYTFKKEATTPDYSILKLLYERNIFGSPKAKFVGNIGLSLYHNPNPTMNQQNVRDFAAALSLEGKAGRSPFIFDLEGDESQVTFSFTGRYQRMFENRGIAGKKADIGVAQFKVEIPFLTGASFPFSVTYANATEQIKEDHVRANFGFSFDADKLLLLRNLSKFLRGSGRRAGP